MRTFPRRPPRPLPCRLRVACFIVAAGVGSVACTSCSCAPPLPSLPAFTASPAHVDQRFFTMQGALRATCPAFARGRRRGGLSSTPC
jgi:hypothetical protein